LLSVIKYRGATPTKILDARNHHLWFLAALRKKMSIVTHLMRAKGTDEAKAGTSMTSNAYEVCGSSKTATTRF